MERTDTPDTAHLDSLQLNLSHERMRLAAAKSQPERKLRTVWVQQLEKEVVAERKILNMDAEPSIMLTDDEILAQLGM